MGARRPPLLPRRAHASAVLFGGPDVHRRALAGDALGPAAAAPAGPTARGVHRARVEATGTPPAPRLPPTTRRDTDAGAGAWFDAAIAYRRDLAGAGLAGLTWARRTITAGRGSPRSTRSRSPGGARGHETFSEVFTRRRRDVRAGDPLAGQRRPALPVHLRPLLSGGGVLVPAVLRAGGGLGPRLAAHPGRCPTETGWRVTGQKVWTTVRALRRSRPAAGPHRSRRAEAPRTHDVRRSTWGTPGIRNNRPLRQMTGDEEFCEVFITGRPHRRRREPAR